MVTFYDADGEIITILDVNPEEYLYVLGTEARPDSGVFFTRMTTPDGFDVSVDTLAEYRRGERLEEFSRTIDRMNPIWYNSLTAQEQTDLATWRQAWLDYPATGVRPTDLDIYN